MKIEQRLLSFVVRANWVLLFAAGLVGFAVAQPDFTYGILSGGLIVTVNFYLLARTLRKALQPPHLTSPAAVIAKYYLRFTVSGVVIFILVYWKLVDPIGLVVGLSIVVASIVLATGAELKRLLARQSE